MSSVGLDARAREGGGGTGASDGRTLGRWWRKPRSGVARRGMMAGTLKLSLIE
jgi:hypothetical protein